MKGYVLRYLGSAASGSTNEEALHAIPALLRNLIFTLARKHVIAASFETEHAEDREHVHRLAYLRAIERPAINANAAEDVNRAFEANRQPAKEHRAGRELALFFLAGLCVLIGGATFALWPRPAAAPIPAAALSAPSRDVLDEIPDPPLTVFFRDTLPEYSIALDARSAGRERRAPNDVATARAKVLTDVAAIAPSLTPSLTSLLDAAESFTAGAAENADEEWTNRLVLVHDALEAASVPFYIDAQLVSYYAGRHRILLSTYDVRERRTFGATLDDGTQSRVECLELARLDRLNHEQSLLGYTRPDLRYALVLVDQLEDFAVSRLLPSIHSVDESTFVRGYDDEPDVHWVTRFEAWAHEDLEQEARGLFLTAPPDTASLRELAAAITRRKSAIRAINGALMSSGVQFLEPDAMDYDASQFTDYRGQLREGQISEARQSQDGLVLPRMMRAVRVILEARALSIASHEVQHRLDYEDGRLATIPAMLAEYTGETVSEDAVNYRAEAANAELSAYLAQIARQPATARTELLNVASFAMDRRSWRRAETYAGIVLFQAIAREAGIAHTPLLHHRRIDRGELARIYGELRGRGGEEIARLARTAWASLYGTALPTLHLESR